MEIRLTPVPALHFTVRVPVEAGEENVIRNPVLLKRVFDSPEFPATAQTQYVSPGVMEVTGLAAGRYDVSIRSSNPADAQQFSEIDLEHDGQDLNATDSEPMTKLTMVVRANGKFYAVSRITSSSGETSGHDLTVASPAMEVTAELTEGVVTIEGVVSKAGMATPGIMIALVPSDPASHVEYFRRDQSDFDGTFSLPGVIPGSFTEVKFKPRR